MSGSTQKTCIKRSVLHSCGSAIKKLIDTRLKNVEIDRQATSTHRFLRRDVWQDICFCANNAYVDVLNGEVLNEDFDVWPGDRDRLPRDLLHLGNGKSLVRSGAWSPFRPPKITRILYPAGRSSTAKTI